ncbi:autotransporter outer membrane beta-barrel domain-containing protein [Fusobacterium ulcerans]
MIEKIKKNNKKRNLNIAVATIAGFLLSSGMTYGKIINIENPVTENTTYTDEKTILNADPLDNGVIIKDKSTPNDMIITAKDLTINQTVTTEGGKDSLGTISLENGKLDINVDKLNINSDFTKNNGTSLTGISASGSEDTTGTLLLNAKEDININITKTGTGAESISDLGTGINVYSHGDMEINSKNLNIAVEITDSFYSAGIHNEGKIAIKTDNIKIDAKSDGEIYGIHNNGSSFKINNNDLIEINVTGDIGVAILNIDGNTTINSGNTILSATSAANGNTRTYGIDSLDGNVEINGGLEIKTRSEHDKNDIAVSSKNGTVNLNKDNDAVAVKIEGKLDAREASRIKLNLNGSDSYLLGGTLLNDTGEINLGVANNAVWKNEGDSTVTSLNFNNGIIDMTHESGKQTIEIKEISGNNGRIVMDISPDDSKTDYIKINKGLTDQTHHIETGEESILSLKDYDFNEKILIGETAKNVNLKGSNFTDIKNIFDYSLDLESQEDGKDTTKNNWYVTGMEKKEGAAVEGVMDDLSLQYMNAGLARVEADMIHKRLGDIRDSKEGAGTWAKVVSGQVESDKNGYFKNDYTMIQAGVDKTETTATGT